MIKTILMHFDINQSYTLQSFKYLCRFKTNSMFSEGYEERYEGDDGDDAHIVVSSPSIDAANTSLISF